MNNIMHQEYPSFEQLGSKNYGDSCAALTELSLNLKSQLNSLKCIKKSFARRFDSPMLSSGNKESTIDVDYEQKYLDMKAKNEELEESYQKLIEDTLTELKDNRQSFEKKIKSLEDELVQKDKFIEVMRQGQINAQEKVHVMETRITSLEQLNATLTLQLKDKTKEVSDSVDGVSNSMTSRSRDLFTMKTDFTRIMDRIGGLEDIIKNLKESKKEDGKAFEDMKNRYEDQKTENFELLMDNKRLKNRIDELETKLSSFDKSSIERRHQTDEFLKTLEGYQSSLHAMNKVHMELDTVCGPLREQNQRLIEDKEKLIDENRSLKKRIIELEQPQPKRSEEAMDEEGNNTVKEGDASQEKAQSNGVKGVDYKFYIEIMEKFKELEKSIETKEKENEDIQTELCELKAKNLELETKIISMNRSPKHRNGNSDQFLSVDFEPQSATSPRKRANARKNSTETSENKKQTEREDESKENDNDTYKDQRDRNEDELENEPRLKITRKPKQAKKNTNTFNLLTGITICPNCSLIIKKADKNTKDCSKCHTNLHEKCAGDQAEDNILCQPCLEKAKKESQENMDEEVDDEEANEKQT